MKKNNVLPATNSLNTVMVSITKALFGNKEARENRANTTRNYQKGRVKVLYSWDGTAALITLDCEAMNSNTIDMVFGVCSDLKKIPRFECNIEGYTHVWCTFNRETNKVEKVPSRKFMEIR